MVTAFVKIRGRLAMVIANELRDQLNLSPSQITTEGKCPDEPIADNATAAGRETNRRVEFKLIN